ncbi:integrase arm-type DNA-binding domain-containing protein [Bradyrhizobium sp. 4]|uniref:tyrosine-type recombinase/integrase n=1 Tax=unclassified Bradyrhizobium TaxID=2631580 RepID=UPI001FFB515C|nr:MULTISPECIES: site-specific integrase [unclassified Bradyrhizobium]MCK1400102.1 integrase arm-type DNA-binding domain-containing protein [Bradyrhizobium sp. 39]MCK1750392.1 integrase arm-type DNA-binding domain-containing protein [Bradyrhizobium sp. 135]UPJ32001.1 integrase arm-type DNA-binding domain-containing protein [Bradyrhizobium sp. 4]
MGRAVNQLSDKWIKKTDIPPGLYGDGNGLYLQVSSFNTKSWIFRFMLSGRARKMGLGDLDQVSLKDARKLAQAQRLIVVDGRDPIEERNVRKLALVADRETQKAKATTFRQCAEAYIKANQAGWKSAKHGAQWAATLETYAYPTIGNLPVALVDRPHVMKILEPIWTTKTETASRVRGRIEKILDRAKAMGLRDGENPARWVGHLDQLLPAKSQVAPVEHFTALPYKKLPAFMTKLRKRDGISARALEFTVLNITRTANTIGAKWDQIDETERTWTIPGELMKGKKGKRRSAHVIPLSDRAMAILQDLPRESDFIFPGGKAGSGLSNMAMAETLKEMGYDGDTATVHGFRSTFKDWASEQTAYANELTEMAMAHIVSDKTERAYRRGDQREKRVRLMQDWAGYCEAKAPAGDNVVQINQVRERA